jgi:hypothetical protein
MAKPYIRLVNCPHCGRRFGIRNDVSLETCVFCQGALHLKPIDQDSPAQPVSKKGRVMHASARHISQQSDTKHKPANSHVEVPASKAPTIVSPVVDGENKTPDPVLLTPPAPIIPVASEPSRKTLGKQTGFFFATIGIMVFLLLMASLVTWIVAPKLVEDLISRGLGGDANNGSGGSNSICSQFHAEYGNIGPCTPGNPPKSGYQWCDVTMKDGGIGQRYVPDQCIK